MSHENDKLSWPSLAQHFDAPKDYRGHFGWLCGYSADAPFLSDAAERFTRMTSAQRAHLGRIFLGVFLDPGNPPITVRDAPGVAHLPIRDSVTKPFRLLHAKIALLGFRHADKSDCWHLRLIVSTGNWTRQTLEESLDLVWRIDVDTEMLASSANDVLQACADIKAAQGLLQWLGGYFDTRLLSVAPQGKFDATGHARQLVDSWIALCSERARGRARLFDTRSDSLLGQLSDQIKACSNDVTRNYLAMGSGFYETTNEHARLPVIPGAIIDTLKRASLLTKSPELDLFVNPQACQAIANSVAALTKQGVSIRQAAQPSCVFGTGKPRTLHAKFLFSANYRENSSTCNSAWIYLGSGNLTGPGFGKKMGAGAGNLEAGVVFAPMNLHWRGGKGIEAWQVVTNLLPIQWVEEFDSSSNQLMPGTDKEPHDSCYTASPVAWLNWWECAEGNELRVPEPVSGDFAVLDSAGASCLRTETGFQWLNPLPRQVRCRWGAHGQHHEGELPVVDEFGRIAATKLLAIGLDEAYWQLADFPLPPDGDENDPNGDGGEENGDENHKREAARGSGQPASYPIRQMMELIENIATKQTEIVEMDWPLWCLRLEQTLGQAKECPAVKAFHKLGLNPLSPLWHVAFRPAFAETSDSQAGQLYEITLASIEKAWAVDHLKAIGE